MNKLLQRLLHICLIATLFFTSGSMAYAQSERFVTGTVTDDLGEPLPGVTVQVVNEGRGITTNLDGQYNVRVNGSRSVLRFSYIGFKTQEITVGELGVINVQLKQESDFLDSASEIGSKS